MTCSPFACVCTRVYVWLYGMPPSVQIIGMEGQHVLDAGPLQSLAVRFMKKIRSDPRYKNMLVVGLVEFTGERFRPQAFDEWWSNFPPYVSARDPRAKSADPRPGVPTLELEKRAYVHMLNSRLQRGTIYLEENLFTLCDPMSMHMKLHTQLKNFCLIRERKMVDGEPKYKIKYSGKHAGPDDVCMSLQLGIYHSDYIINKTNYIQALVRNGPIRCSTESTDPCTSGVFGNPQPAAADSKDTKKHRKRKESTPPASEPSDAKAVPDEDSNITEPPAAKIRRTSNSNARGAPSQPSSSPSPSPSPHSHSNRSRECDAMDTTD